MNLQNGFKKSLPKRDFCISDGYLVRKGYKGSSFQAIEREGDDRLKKNDLAGFHEAERKAALLNQAFLDGVLTDRDEIEINSERYSKKTVIEGGVSEEFLAITHVNPNKDKDIVEFYSKLGPLRPQWIGGEPYSDSQSWKSDPLDSVRRAFSYFQLNMILQESVWKHDWESCIKTVQKLIHVLPGWNGIKFDNEPAEYHVVEDCLEKVLSPLFTGRACRTLSPGEADFFSFLVNKLVLLEEKSFRECIELCTKPYRKDKVWLAVNLSNPIERKDGRYQIDPWLIENELKIIKGLKNINQSVILRCSAEIVNQIINAHLGSVSPVIEIGNDLKSVNGRYESDIELSAFYFEYFTHLCRGVITKQCEAQGCRVHFIVNRPDRHYCGETCRERMKKKRQRRNQEDKKGDEVNGQS